MRRVAQVLGIAVITLLALACGPAEQQQAARTAPAIPWPQIPDERATPTPLPPSPTATPTAEPTATATPSPTPEPTATPTQAIRALAAPPTPTPHPPPPTTVPTAAPPTQAAQQCSPAYPDFCIPPGPPDLDCPDIGRKRFTVLPPDPHGFDRDRDGIGCE